MKVSCLDVYWLPPSTTGGVSLLDETKKLFDDFESLKEACKLYIWHIKLNNCAKLNLLDEKEIIPQYTKLTGRLCRIANVPVKYEPPDDEENEETEETDGDSSLDPEDQEDDDSEQTDDEANPDEADDKTNPDEADNETNPNQTSDETNPEETSDETTPETEQTTPETEQTTAETEQPINQESFNNIEKFSDTLTDSDYQYIITTAIFIFILYLMYLNYKN